MHQRKLIRQEIVDLLTAGVALVSGRVYKSRTRQIWPEEMPCIAVYTRSDDAETRNAAPREYVRTVAVAVEVMAKLDDDLDDTLDDVCEQVETVLFANEFILNGTAQVILADTQITLTAEGDSQHGSAIITVEATYYQDAPEDISGALDDLKTIGVRYDQDGDQPALDEAQDLITGLDL
jgi:hypothetical protein